MMPFYIYLFYLAVCAYAIFLANVWDRFKEGEWWEWYVQGYFFARLALMGLAFMPIVILLNYLRP
jgi:hypothetical protein